MEILEAIKDGDWVTVVGLIFAVIWTAFGLMARMSRWREVQVQKAEQADGAIERARRLLLAKAAELARGAVTEVWEEYVREIKAAKEDGKLTAEEKRVAQEKALQKMIEEGKTGGFDLIKEFGMPFLKALIEQGVQWAKNKYARPE